MKNQEINRSIAPKFSNNFNIPEVRPQKHELPNGMSLFEINAGSQEVCRVELIVDAGNYFQSLPLLANAVNDLLREGTTSMTSTQIANELDYYGAFLECAATKDKACISLFSLNKHLHKTMPVLMDVYLNAVFPEDELDLYKRKKLQQFKVNQQKVDKVARNQFNQILFEGTPYNQFIEANHFEELHRSALMEFYQSYYHSISTYAVLSGKLSNDTIALVKKHLSEPLLNETHKANHYKTPDLTSKEVFVEIPNAMQSAIFIGRRLFNKKHQDYFGMQVLNTILGGYFGSRLMSNIREDKGYTYGIGSGVSSLIHDGFFSISTEVGTEVTQPALQEIFNEIVQLQQTPVAEEELTLVKNYLLGTFLRSADGPFALADRFTAVHDYGLDHNYYNEYVAKIKSIQPEDLKILANKYLRKEDLSILVVGKKK